MFEIAQVRVYKKGRGWWWQLEEVMFPIPVGMAPMRRKAQGATES